MLKKFKIGSIKIGSKEKTFIIAEIGVNHNGSFRLAVKLIREAKKAGADCVKFQTFTAETLTRKDAKKAPYQIKNTKNKDSQYKMLKKLELKKEFYPKLIKICKKLNIIFLSTPYNFEDVDFLQSIGVQGYKFSSMHLTELKFIDYVSKKRKPVIISTGMSKMTEISKALKILKKNKNPNYVVLQCTTNYPSDIKDSNILCLNSFTKKFKCLVGFSDHTTTNISAITAVALGAKVIEKHFTLNKNMKGPDHLCSYNPKEFKVYVDDIRMTEHALGNSSKNLSKIEKKNVKIMRRSIHSKKLIKKGEKLTLNNLVFLRPNDGIPVSKIDMVLNKTAKKNIPPFTKISFKNFK